MTETTVTSPPEYRTACGGTIKDPSKYPSAEYRGETVYFCTHACLRAFKDDPDALMVGDVDHPQKMIDQ